VNTKSRRGKEWFRDAKELLSSSGLSVTEAISFTLPKDLQAAVKKAVKAEVPLIIVGGGDGTMGMVAKLVAGSQSVLGVLPLGTGNAFARDLGIKADLEQACEVLSAGKVQAVDLGTINGEYFVNVATVGLTTGIAAQLTVETKRRFGRLAYGFAVCRAFLHLKPFLVTIKTKKGEESFQTLQLVIGSGHYHAGPFPLSPTSSIVDGKLDLYAVASCSRWTLLKYAFFLPGGQFTHMDEVTAEATTGGRIEATPVKKVTVDGEIKLRTPFDFGIAPGALRVMVPQDFGIKEPASG
jgi:diacylglycerol kinase (ATP)